MNGLVIGDSVLEWVAKETKSAFVQSQAIGWAKDGKIVAGVVYSDWNGPNVVCHIASDGSKRWMTKKYLKTIFDYPFTQMNCDRITVYVGEGNKPSLNLVKKLGFTLEARLSSAHPTGDLLIHRLWKRDCRWLEIT